MRPLFLVFSVLISSAQAFGLGYGCRGGSGYQVLVEHHLEGAGKRHVEQVRISHKVKGHLASADEREVKKALFYNRVEYHLPGSVKMSADRITVQVQLYEGREFLLKSETTTGNLIFISDRKKKVKLSCFRYEGHEPPPTIRWDDSP